MVWELWAVNNQYSCRNTDKGKDSRPHVEGFNRSLWKCVCHVRIPQWFIEIHSIPVSLLDFSASWSKKRVFYRPPCGFIPLSGSKASTNYKFSPRPRLFVCQRCDSSWSISRWCVVCVGDSCVVRYNVFIFRSVIISVILLMLFHIHLAVTHTHSLPQFLVKTVWNYSFDAYTLRYAGWSILRTGQHCWSKGSVQNQSIFFQRLHVYT